MGKRVRLESGTLTLGRGTHNDLCVDDPGVSRSHCKLVIQGSQVQLVDLKSTNGTYVQGNRVQEITLEDGHQILVGTTVLMSFIGPEPEPNERDRNPAPPPPPPPPPPATPAGQALPPALAMATERLKLQIGRKPPPGRGDWIDHARQEVTNSLSQGRPVSLALFRLDNTSLGGEALRQSIASLRPGLAVGLLPSQEVAVLMPGLSGQASLELVEPLLVQVESDPNPSHGLAVSVGVVTALTIAQGKLDDLLHQAREALSQAQKKSPPRIQAVAAAIPIAHATVVVKAPEELLAILKQKRRNSRTDCKADLVVRIDNQDHPAQLCDLGIGGLRINSKVPLNLGDVVEIRLRQQPHSAVRAAVKWLNGPMMGLHFRDPADNLRNSWVSHLLKQLGRNAESARERRAHARIQLEQSLTLSSPQGAYTGILSNIGPGGAGVESVLPPPLGLVGQVQIADLQVRCKVIWVSGRRFGLQFVPLSDQQQLLLQALLKGRVKPSSLGTGFIPLE